MILYKPCYDLNSQPTPDRVLTTPTGPFLSPGGKVHPKESLRQRQPSFCYLRKSGYKSWLLCCDAAIYWEKKRSTHPTIYLFNIKNNISLSLAGVSSSSYSYRNSNKSSIGSEPVGW